MKKLIINADDFGLAENFNKGIVELINKGIVSSITVMVEKKYTGKRWFSKEIRDPNQKLSIGLHLVLSEKTTQKEIEGQIDAFKKIVGKLPSHLDGHQHCHLREKNFSKILMVAKNYNLPVRSISDIDRKILKDKKIKTPDRYITWHPSNKEALFEKLKKSGEGITEMVCHVGYQDFNTAYPYNKQRREELDVLESKDFIRAIKDFEIVGYDSLKAD